ncbi:condensation domain-containing protein [Goodfellowiella coeruleoviolacea]|uniref:Condensation domain-containing protein n=1 Tax=Goodfellowiella coeruleoviolacea TaxID=334858 RepID=A0AAE3GCC8_9PSEU|nr:condensation domain-containing protein [Goodfellowiella coeruleoviolacea]MCP2164799.1 Condensation domain-containing protein [Goodfellowiella coeruleoviolacea]
MLQIPLVELDIEPGHVVEWRPYSKKMHNAGDPAPPHGIASYNQEKHFAVALEARSANDSFGSYIAVTFEISGPPDRAAIEAALLHFIRRHEVLRCEFRPLGENLACDAFEPDDIALEPVDLGPVDSASELRAYLADCFEKNVDALSWPPLVMGVVTRPESATVYLAFDHIVLDGVSTPIAVHDIATAYAMFTGGQRVVLPEVGSYVDFSREERRRTAAMDVDDSRLDYWKGFMARNGGFFPSFPLDLGIEPGGMYPTVNDAATLLGAAEVDALEGRCRAVGGKLFMAVLAAVGVSLRKEGGPDVYRGLMPISERGDGCYAGAVGWFVNTLPIELRVAEDQDFAEVMAGAQVATAEMLRHTDVPFVKAWHLLAPQYARLRSWPFAVNFLSYLDFRKALGAEHHLRWKARMHIWSSHSNGMCFWFHRTDTGLHLNTVYADTPQARRTRAAFGRTLARTIANMAHSGTF